MPRAGGEASKRGDRYEELWTIHCLIDLAVGDVEGMVVEPTLDEARGIEFVVFQAGGVREFHSVKRQLADKEWTIRKLSEPVGADKRSILGDLVCRLDGDKSARVCFVSSTGANELRELAERAARPASYREFEDELRKESSESLRNGFTQYAERVASTREAAYAQLRRTRVAIIDEATLGRMVDQRLDQHLYRPDSAPFRGTGVRGLLGELIQKHLRTTLRREAVWEALELGGYRRKDWATDVPVKTPFETSIAASCGRFRRTWSMAS